MSEPMKQVLLLLVFCTILIPTAARCGSIDTQGAQAPLDAGGQVPGQMTLPQPSDVRYTDMAVPASPSGGTEGQTGTTPPPAAKNEKIVVVREQEAEHAQGVNAALTIAFGISLALNIFLFTSRIAHRKDQRRGF
jgi:hypothetical protein